MQNRLILTGIPPQVPSLPGSADALRDLVEREGCWVDRFAFLLDDGHGGGCGGGDANDGATSAVVAAAELHLENVRDGTVAALDGRTVVLGGGGSGDDGEDPDVSAELLVDGDESLLSPADSAVKFRIRAAPASKAQGRRLVELCPLHDDPGERVQTLNLPWGIRLTVGRSTGGGGTGAEPWRGGVLLATQLCSWFGGVGVSGNGRGRAEHIDGSAAMMIPDIRSLFHGRDVVELGAGAAGLPSMALAALSRAGYPAGDGPVVPRRISATDGIDEIVAVLRLNVARNGLDHAVDVRHCDWNALAPPLIGDDGDDISSLSADTILFADCVYNEQCASALCGAIDHLLRPGGNVVGVLPDFRVGLSLFEASMERIGFCSVDVPLTETGKGNDVNDVDHPRAESGELVGTPLARNRKRFCCAGSGGKNYRTVWWRDQRSEIR